MKDQGLLQRKVAEMATILVVDDTPDNLTLMGALLKDEYRVKIANSGAKALTIAALERPPDLILLDIMMPGMDGYEVCQRLKGDPKTRNIPVIFLTAKAEMEDEQKGLELGAVDYITKPISPPIVLARVKNHLALKALTDTLRDQNIALESARASAEQANLAKTSFLASMSHELRSPLNAILGFAQLLESESPPPSPAQAESVEQILSAGWHLLVLINEILDLSKVESGQVSMSVEPVALADVLLECWGMVQPQAKKLGISILFPPFDIPHFIQADRTRVKQVLINLLSNAIKYNQGGGEVQVECAATPQGNLRISVRDTGLGLPPEQLERLFQPFDRLGQECGPIEGTGIGLVVAKRLVELMGGEIGVSSTVGIGSVFWFELNSAAEPHIGLDEGEGRVPVEAARSLQLPPHTLLYVEDNSANVKLVEQIIGRRPDLRLLTAMDARRGIDLACKYQPEVILMDINLAGISGLQALEILRDNPLTAHIPVLALSANAMPSDIKKGLEAGFFRYLTKPIKVKEFLEAVDMVLEYAHTNRLKALNEASSK